MVTQTGKAVLKRLASGQKPNRGAPTVADCPAGGTGAAAGGWDTANNRNAAITSINAVIAQLRAIGIIN
ncbi:MAG: hypothetical protein LLG14_27210 [Nocardiaceae bacterium]|nr:hypothetical protein [Nocardiaceae bacterium]